MLTRIEPAEEQPSQSSKMGSWRRREPLSESPRACQYLGSGPTNLPILTYCNKPLAYSCCAFYPRPWRSGLSHLASSKTPALLQMQHHIADPLAQGHRTSDLGLQLP